MSQIQVCLSAASTFLDLHALANALGPRHAAGSPKSIESGPDSSSFRGLRCWRRARAKALEALHLANRVSGGRSGVIDRRCASCFFFLAGVNGPKDCMGMDRHVAFVFLLFAAWVKLSTRFRRLRRSPIVPGLGGGHPDGHVAEWPRKPGAGTNTTLSGRPHFCPLVLH